MLVGSALALAACGSDGPTTPDSEEDALVLPETHSPAWIGTYVGTGEGIVEGADVRFDPARLTIALDADSVRDDRCFLCVTVRLDSLFVLTNVNPDSPVSLTLRTRTGGRDRTLLLERFSGGGYIGNVLQVRLQGQSTSGTGPATDVSYLLERR